MLTPELKERVAKADAAVAKRKAEKEAERVKRNAEARLANLEHARNKGHKTRRNNARVLIPALNGCVMMVSDQHYYPGLPPSAAHRASLIVAKKLKPYAIISNGDSIDGASISRWPVSSYREMGERPMVAAEIGEAAARMRDYEKLKFVRWLTWNMGNHDSRFETKLAERVPQYAGVNGFTLKDHFPGWIPAWSTWIMADPDDVAPLVATKHRFKGGLYGAHNNALWAGVSIATGHDHMLWDKPITDLNGMRWGMGAGTMAPIDSPHFLHYTEDNPTNWQSGLLLLHFRDGRFTGPERIHVVGNTMFFRGDAISV